jgi:hypothetical protein
MIDHRELLRKYIDHVLTWEGADYIDTWRHGPEFTDEEWAELVALQSPARPSPTPEAKLQAHDIAREVINQILKR